MWENFLDLWVQMKKDFREVEEVVSSYPRQEGGDSLYPETSYTRILLKAEDEMKKLEDTFISVEHIFLAMLKERNSDLSNLLKKYNLTYEAFKQTLLSFRKGRVVDSENPNVDGEGILEKYGRDLTEEARLGKIDPVIGRDEEIRHTIRILSRRTKITLFLLVSQVLVRLQLLKALLEE